MTTVILLGFVSMLTDISTEMVYPLLPLYLTSTLGAGPAVVGVIEGIAESLAGLLKVYSGYLSDRLRRRKALALVGYGSSTLGKAFLYLSTSWGWVLIGRVVDRFGKGIRTAPRDALIADASGTGNLGRSFGLHRAMDTLGAVIGVAVAYRILVANQQHYRGVFMLSLIPAALGVGLLCFAKETRRGRAAAETVTNPFAGWKALSPRLKAFFALTLVFALGNSSNQFLLLKARDVGFSPAQVVLLYLMFNLVYSAVSYPAGRLSDKIGRKTLLVCGYALYGLVYIGFGLVRDARYIWALFGMYGLYSAFTEGIEKALVSELSAEENRATMLGIHASLVGIGLLPASLIAGFLWRWLGASAPFYFGGVMGLLAAVGMGFVVPRTVRHA